MASARVSRIVALAGALLSLCLILGALSAAAADEPPVFEYRSSFGPDGTEETNFELVGSVGIDQGSGAVYVIDRTGSLYKFDSDGKPLPFTGTAGYIAGNAIRGLSLYSGENESQVAVDPSSHVVYVTTSDDVIRAFQENGEPANFSAGAGAGTSSLPVGGELLGVAVDSQGNIYASDYFGRVKIFAADGAFITEFETEKPAGLAVAPDGDLYVSQYGGPVRRFAPSSFPIDSSTLYTADSQPLDDHLSKAVAVDPASENVYVAEHGYELQKTLIAVYSPDGSLIISVGEDEYVSRIGVGVNGSTGHVFVGANDESGEEAPSQVEIYAPEEIFVGPPTVVSTSVSGVTADTATLGAEINPNTLPTSYRFEYGTDDCGVSPGSCIAVPADAGPVGSGHKPVFVSERLTGLVPSTTYHYRVIAENDKGDVTPGPDRTFTTQGSGLGFDLSDSRAWEMVSPPDKFGGQIRNIQIGAIQAAADGGAFAYISLGSIEPDPVGNRAIEPSTVIARREGGAWRSTDITPPHTRFTTVGPPEYDLFNSDLSLGVLEVHDGTPLSPAASERTPYLRQNSDEPLYTPLVTGKDGFANVPAGTEFGGPEPGGPLSEVTVAGAAADLRHVALRSGVPLVEDAPAGSLYEWGAGRLEAVSVLPAGEGGTITQAFLGSQQGTVRGAVSGDGSRVFWSPGSIGTGGIFFTGLYLRDTEADVSARLDVKQLDASGLGVSHPAFQGASDDGSVVFFTDSRQLTTDASADGRDLYRCTIPTGAAADGCASLTDISAPISDSGENAEVEGLVPAISSDGSRAYFVARGALTTTPNAVGQAAGPGEPNLYLWDEEQGLRFIATLSPEDDRDWGKVNGQTPGYQATVSAAASPSGRYFAFMSELNLTGYESRSGGFGSRNEEVFRYDAETDDLACVSCNPSQASPTAAPPPASVVNPDRSWAGRAVAALLPQARASVGTAETRYPVYAPRSVLDNGRVFFNAVDALVSADSNGEWDVYQYEPQGLGDCTAASGGAAVSRTGDGCVSLLSSGTDNHPSAFLDASASGDDVFFMTAGRLSVRDVDTVNDVYDARVGGVADVLSPVAECAGEACQPSLAPPSPPTPASEAFHGAQGGAACPKGKRKVQRRGKTRCVRKHKRHRHHHPRRLGAGPRGAHR